MQGKGAVGLPIWNRSPPPPPCIKTYIFLCLLYYRYLWKNTEIYPTKNSYSRTSTGLNKTNLRYQKTDFRSDQICFAFVCVHTLASTASFDVIVTRDFNYPSFFVQVLSDQHQFSQNFHLRENALIFYQILPTNSFRKCMEISLENFYVDIVA